MGLYALWYPIKERTIIDRFHKNIKENTQSQKLIIELTLYPDDSPPNYLKGCGMLILNPPWKFEQTIKPILSYMCKIFSHNQGRTACYFL